MDARQHRTLTHRAVLAGVLWLGFWVLGLVLAAALLWVPLAQSLYEGGVGASGWLSGGGGVAILWALRPRGWWKKREAGPAGLDAASYPALHALVAEAGRLAGERVPDAVHLVSKATAFISVEREQLLSRRRVIGVGLPLFAFLSREELGSVLVHEFGHGQGGDLVLGPWVHRTGSSLAAVIDALEGSAFFLDAPFRAYGKLFLRVSGDVSREQELSADAHAAEVYGANATCSALDKVHRLGHFWEVYFQLDAVPVIELGCRPPLIEGFRRFLSQPALRPDVVEGLKMRARAKPLPGDTHPPLEERIAALAPAVPPKAEPSVKDLETHSLDLLGGERAAEAAWYQRATRGELVTLDWDEVGPKLLLPKLLEDFAEASINPSTTALSTLPDKVRDAEGFWNRLRTPGVSLLSPAAQRRRGELVLGQWLAAALFARGFFPEVRPGAHLRLSRGATSIVPAEVVQELAQGVLSSAEFRIRSATWEAPD
jgi:Zn-dependent protease with chaperone function